jgi:8-oxo-dGTP diphosphatase
MSCPPMLNDSRHCNDTVKSTNKKMKQPNNPKQILPAVAVAIFNENGEILLQKRKDVNKWCIISGHVEFGESIENAVLREIEEETNVKASIVRLIGVYSSPGSQTYFYKDKTVQYITSYFEAKLTDTFCPDFSNNETQQLKFFKPENIPDDLALINSNWLTDALSKREIAFIR